MPKRLGYFENFSYPVIKGILIAEAVSSFTAAPLFLRFEEVGKWWRRLRTLVV